jgi:hypothetical protein
MLTINSEFPLRDKGVSNALEIDKLPRHRWYFVKEGFSPTLVEQAVNTDGIEPGELLLDPFSGSGTASVAGAIAGLRTKAFEINPFLRFLSATKLHKAREVQFRKASGIVLQALERPVESPLEGYSTFTKGNRWERWLFPLSVLRAFEAGKRAAALTDDSKHRGLLKLALIGAAMDCCNATRDGKCLRFHKDWAKHQVTAARLRDQFESRVNAMAADLLEVPLQNSNARVLEGDARHLIGRLREKFRICVTSPPYLNSFDYSDIYRPELFLGDFVNSNHALMKIRLKTVRSHVQARWCEPKKDQFGTLYLDSISKLRERGDELWDSRLPTMVQAYFEDMEKVLKDLRARARKNASVWLVVSTSAYAGVEIPVDLILAEIGQRSGWFLREVGVLRHLRSSSQHVEHVDDKERKSVPLRESVVIFDACARDRCHSIKSARDTTRKPVAQKGNA